MHQRENRTVEIIPWKYRTRAGTARITDGIASWMRSFPSNIYRAAAIEITSEPLSDEVMISLYHLADETSVYIKDRLFYPGQMLWELLDELMEPIFSRLRAESEYVSGAVVSQEHSAREDHVASRC